MDRITLKGKAADDFMRSALKASEPPVAGASADSAKMYVIQWTDAWGRTKERTVWAESRLAALRQVQRSTTRIVSPNAELCHRDEPVVTPKTQQR